MTDNNDTAKVEGQSPLLCEAPFIRQTVLSWYGPIAVPRADTPWNETLRWVQGEFPTFSAVEIDSSRFAKVMNVCGRMDGKALLYPVSTGSNNTSKEIRIFENTELAPDTINVELVKTFEPYNSAPEGV